MSEWPEAQEERRALFFPLWADALRSGKYKQGLHRLRRGDSFCCLGVACDMGEQGDWVKSGDYGEHTYAGAHVFVPFPIRQKMGLTSIEMEELAKLNDHGKPFGRIADRIEAMLIEGVPK